MVTRVLVVDDSATFRSLLRSILHDDPSLKVAGEAANGKEAIELARKLKPDVITMDVQMPMIDGLEAIRRIMESDPRPIVVVSGSLDPKDVKQAFSAIEAGALAVVAKPPSPGHPTFPAKVQDIVRTLKLMAEVKVVKRRERERPVEASELPPPASGRATIELVAIAASTGGPTALETILRALPGDLPVPIAIVQHIAVGFEQGLVDWLQGISELEVRLAYEGAPLRPGEAMVSRADRHLMVARRRVTLGDGPTVDGHRPSASTLFSSAARSFRSGALGVILTGMGKDGTRGLIELKAAGGPVIGQDAATSVVDGMPGAARDAGVVDHVLPVEAIGPAIVRICSSGSRHGSA